MGMTGMVIKLLHISGVGWHGKESKAETEVGGALKVVYIMRSNQ